MIAMKEGPNVFVPNARSLACMEREQNANMQKQEFKKFIPLRSSPCVRFFHKGRACRDVVEV
jgi:hypothetical protein